MIKCFFCKYKEVEFDGINSEQAVRCKNPACKKIIPFSYIKNKITLISKQLGQQFYTSTYKCTEQECLLETKQISVQEKCINARCQGKLRKTFTEKDVTNTFSYLYALFDQTGKFLTDGAIGEKDDEIKKIAKYVEFLKKENSYDKIELKNIFEFMSAYPY